MSAPTFTYPTEPAGARVVLEGTPERVLGKSDEPLPVPPGHGLVKLRFELDGYQPAEVTLQSQTLQGSRPPLHLHAEPHWEGFVAIGLALLAGVAAMLWQRRPRPVEAVKKADRAGTQVGPYILLELLGRGGAGEVFRAMRQDGGAPQGEVALKLVRPERRERADAERRLARETALLQRLSHPAIVRFLDHGQAGDMLYLVEELLEGGMLTDLIPEHGMELPDFFAHFLPLVDAVAFAHEQGVVHRDLKPSNVLLSGAGEVRITDFGLARADESTVMTTNHCMGTPIFMAPELFSGEPANALSDQFSLGVMAYQMLAGEAPFQGDTVMELVAQHLRPPRPFTRPLPPALQQVVQRMLQADPAERFSTMREVASALQEAQR